MSNRLDIRHSAHFYTLLLIVAIVVQLLLAVLLSSFTSDIAYWMLSGLYSLALLLCGYLYCRGNKIDMLSSVRLSKSPRVIDSIWLCGIIFALVNGMTPVNDWFVSIIESVGGSVGGIDSALLYDNIVLAIVVVCIIAPVVEEIIFRGIIGSGLLSGGRVVVAIVISALIFALFHMSASQLLHQFVTGCILMIFLWRSGSIWVPIVGHIFNNGIVLVLDYYVYSSGWYTDNAVCVAIVGIGVALIATIGYVYYSRRRQSDYYVQQTVYSIDRWVLGITMALSLLMLVVGVL